MMTSAPDSAAEKFLTIPELVEKQISFLDINSIASLAEIQPMIIKLLQRAPIWNNLIRRSCQSWKIVNCAEQDFEETFEQKRMEIANLVKMLKKMEDPNRFLLGLLHDIVHEGTNQGITVVQLRCPQCPHSPEPTSHKAWEWHFLLLEEVEGAFGSVVQQIETIKMNPQQGNRFGMRQAWLLAISSRARRQQTRIALVDVSTFSCSDLIEAQAFLALAENCQVMKLRDLRIAGEIGAEGWTALAKALRLHPNCHFWSVDVPKHVMLKGRREDLRTVWDQLFNDASAQWTLAGRSDVAPFTRRGTDENRKKEWKRLEKVLETNEEKNNAFMWKGNKKVFLLP